MKGTSQVCLLLIVAVTFFSVCFAAPALWSTKSGDLGYTYSTSAMMNDPRTKKPAMEYTPMWSYNASSPSGTPPPVISPDNYIYTANVSNGHVHLTQISPSGSTYTLTTDITNFKDHDFKKVAMSFTPSGNYLILLCSAPVTATISRTGVVYQFINNLPVVNGTFSLAVTNTTDLNPYFTTNDILLLTDTWFLFSASRFGGGDDWYYCQFVLGPNKGESETITGLYSPNSVAAASCYVANDTCSVYFGQIQGDHVAIAYYAFIGNYTGKYPNLYPVWAQNITQVVAPLQLVGIKVYMHSKEAAFLHLSLGVTVNGAFVNTTQSIYKFTADGKQVGHFYKEFAGAAGSNGAYAYDTIHSQIWIPTPRVLMAVDTETMQVTREVEVERLYNAAAVDGSGRVYLALPDHMEVIDANGTRVWNSSIEPKLSYLVTISLGNGIGVLADDGGYARGVFAGIPENHSDESKFAKWKIALIVVLVVIGVCCALLVLGVVVFLLTRKRGYEQIQ
eukprot:TRINITY_DN974_c0_g1_i1.p1 TRINITY_DN974_c0_g1~~TRINITY_DN974_c0_g1_i1.p1  ORF type:complete len:505 (-),score=78.46 TRINITY_DN974_c0_g1_i1:130-1644(-)